MKWLRPALLAVLLPLSGCETVTGWFDDEDFDATAPVELTDIEEQVDIDSAWSTSVGDGQGDGFYQINPILDNDLIYAASADGEVAAIETDRGRERWAVDLEIPISGGVGKFGDSLFLGGADGFVIRLSATDGSVVWQTAVSGEVLSAPQGDGRFVVAQSYDGKLNGFDYESGERLWTYSSDVPVLTLRGTSTPILSDGVAIAGFAEGKVVAIEVETGNVLWESRVAIPEGRSEIERIIDIDGTMVYLGPELFVSSYQGRLVSIDTSTGRKRWQRNVSSVSGVSMGFGNVYVADEDGTVSAFLRNGQGVRWQNIVLGYRGLSRPTPISSYVAVVDFEGYLHLLSQVDGRIVGRERPDSDGARADMIADGNRLYVYGNGGRLVAYDLRSLE
ncbi:outer membrane assembly lipoprotein YfgL [Luminiphilus syltensis NOR5-1B]|uniref:Outer membrane protein assembly factor BamB n=1 Tax=Luminiphilus syltensis NOR5-1B TaxID=565045 RepID=B8KXH7_9GAMM|nr:outer membrane protein assembly factor BamB [Luminiphilus syltensis]EED34400.1 outer membrane assembly lipoprotein YfgL [Luminiphilus syltensis NOR5-1B]